MSSVWSKTTVRRGTSSRLVRRFSSVARSTRASWMPAIAAVGHGRQFLRPQVGDPRGVEEQGVGVLVQELAVRVRKMVVLPVPVQTRVCGALSTSTAIAVPSALPTVSTEAAPIPPLSSVASACSRLSHSSWTPHSGVQVPGSQVAALRDTGPQRQAEGQAPPAGLVGAAPHAAFHLRQDAGVPRTWRRSASHRPGPGRPGCGRFRTSAIRRTPPPACRTTAGE